MTTIYFRPHHFMCALGFVGKGYSPQFVANFSAIMAELSINESAVIEVVGETDSICQPCPHRQEKRCQSQDKIDRLDQAHADILQLKVGDRLTWRDARKRIRENMTIKKFHQACEGCEWKSLGVCEASLHNNCREDSL